MNRYRPYILFGIAVIVALITSVISYNWLQKKTGVKKVATVETQQVAIAAKDLPAGTVLAEQMINLVPFLKDSVCDGMFSNASDLKGRVLISPVKASEPLLESRLAPTSVTSGGVAALISPNKRAMAVKVDKVIGISGFIHPGHTVDVLVSLARTGKSKSSVTKTVLENIPVLAAGTEVQSGDRQKPSKVDVITLEVSPEEAEKLALAATEGKLKLALRNYTDREEVLTRGTTVSTLLASYSPVEKKIVRQTREVTREAESQKPRAYVVEMIRGSKITEVNLEGGWQGL